MWKTASLLNLVTKGRNFGHIPGERGHHRLRQNRHRPSWRVQAARPLLPVDRRPEAIRNPVNGQRHRDQEQIQMIASAIGTPRPSAPKMARANSVSRLAWGRTSGNDMALLLGAPRARGLAPR